MSNENRITFKVSVDTGKMREQANEIARQEGLIDPAEIDAFRHAYVSAKTQEHIRKMSSHDLIPEKVSDGIAEGGSYVAGSAVEWGRELGDRKNSWGAKGNPKDEWAQDMDNNESGRRIEQDLNDQNLPAEEKEKQLRAKVRDAVKDGTLQTRPDLNNRRYYPNEEDKTSNNQSSIMDGIGDTLGAVGSAAATVGHMAYNTAMSVGKDTLVHMVTQAAGSTHTAGVTQAAQVAMAQTLSRMHGLVMQEVERQQPSQPWRTPGIAGPIPEPDARTKEAITRTINDPRNAGIFKNIGARVAHTELMVSSYQ